MDFKHFHDIDKIFEWIDSQLNKPDEKEKIKEVNGFQTMPIVCYMTKD